MTKEKLDKIKIAYKKVINEYNNDEKTQRKGETNDKFVNSNDFELIFEKLYFSQYENERNEKDKINYINKLQISINTNKSEEKKSKNILSIDNENNDDNDINFIIFRKHKSFEHKYLLKKSEVSNDINDETITSITRTTSTHRKENNSAKENISNNSDYIDLTQANVFAKLNQVQAFMKFQESFGDPKRLRNTYYNKLITTKIWDPSNKEKISNTLFFFDWDDTLMCTSYLLPIVNRNKDYSSLKEIKAKLRNLDENVSSLLKKTLEIGIVFIITNSAPGWVEYSSKNFLPLTAKLLRKIKVISARGMFSKTYPGDPRQWKVQAFFFAIKSYNINKQLISNILNFGDSIIDLEAIYLLKESFANAYLKIIKFKEKPHPIELEKQVFLISEQLDYIVKKVKDLSVKIAKKKLE